ncbi:colanic acid/amylovoran biosynthesis protein [Methanophagales archaeon]|nr:colanic acid/amylovoran biosynthesis protein [Methanophagales archaeon]
MLRFIIWGFFRRKGIDLKWIINSKEHEITEAYYQADCIIGCGGGYINDNYKPAILGRLFNLWFGKFLGKPVMIYAQSLGPFNTRFYRFLSRCVFDRIDLIITRDVISKNILEDIGVTKTQIYANADAAILLEPARGNKTEEILDDLGLNKKDKPIIGITVRKWTFGFENSAEVNERFMRKIAKFADYQVESNKFSVVFFSTPISKGNYYATDMDTVDEIVSMMKYKEKVKSIINNYSPEELKRICGQMDIVIGTRMHSLILSSTMGVPVIGIAYEFKIRDYLESIGQEKYLCEFDNVTFEVLRDIVDNIWENKDEIKREIAINVKKLEEKALKNADLCAKLIRNEQNTYN